MTNKKVSMCNRDTFLSNKGKKKKTSLFPNIFHCTHLGKPAIHTIKSKYPIQKNMIPFQNH